MCAHNCPFLSFPNSDFVFLMVLLLASVVSFFLSLSAIHTRLFTVLSPDHSSNRLPPSLSSRSLLPSSSLLFLPSLPLCAAHTTSTVPSRHSVGSGARAVVGCGAEGSEERRRRHLVLSLRCSTRERGNLSLSENRQRRVLKRSESS